MCDHLPSKSLASSITCDGGMFEPDKHDFVEIVLVRHGETSFNASRIIQGHVDAELNDVGREQACVVAQHLSREHKFGAAYSSDLKRASETAQIISIACNLSEVVQDPGLRERNLGDLQGMTLQDSAKLKPQAYKDFLSRNFDQEIQGGGESINQLHKRCTSTLQKIAMKHIGETVVVVTHGGVIRELYKHAVPGQSPTKKVVNTSINTLHISNDGSLWSIKTWGDTRHLDQTSFLNDAFGGDKTSG